MKSIANQIDFLRKTIEKWNKEYYLYDKPSVSDEEYDLTLRQLIELENKYPEFLTEDSPTKRVGGMVAIEFKKAKHTLPMLSLSNAFSSEELNKFNDDVKKALEIGTSVTYNVEPKIDGLSISLTYIDGLLSSAVTRGDGEYGEDITQNAQTIKTIPLKVNVSIPELIVRGEIFMTFKEFEKINSLISDDSKKFANPRNAAAGSVRNLDSSLVARRNLQMISYNIPDFNHIEKLNLKTQSEVIEFLKKSGFYTAPESKKCNSMEEVILYINELTKDRKKLKFPIDGMVVKVDEINLYSQLGKTSKFPKWAIAYKFPPEIVSTKLLGIKPTVGRTGKITYVAELSPVRISGSLVSFATLHNADYVNQKDIQINDTVQLFKAGDIIPKVIGPIFEKRPKDSRKYVPPTTCPSCGSELVQNEGEVDQYCLNSDCPSRTIQSIIHFCSKKAMNIEELSEKNVEKLFNFGVLKSISDIYTLHLKKHQIVTSDLKIKEKLFNKIITNIENSKTNSLEKLIFALGIKHVGETTAKVLAKKYLSLEKIMHSSIEELSLIEDVGPTVAQSIYDYFKTSVSTIKQLMNQGVNVVYKSDFPFDEKSPYFNKKIVITGTFSAPRDEIINILEKKFNVSIGNSVNKKTDFVLAGQNAGSKLNKAKQLNIPIISSEIWK